MSQRDPSNPDPAVEQVAEGTSGGPRGWQGNLGRFGFVALVAATAIAGAAFGTTVLSTSGDSHSHDDHDHTHEHDDGEPPNSEEGLLPPPVAHASVAHPCLNPGDEQILELQADPGDRIRYRVRYAGDNELSGGDAEEDAPVGDEGTLKAEFTVPEDASAGLAVVAVFIRDAGGEYRGSTHARFEVRAGDAPCPSV